MTPLLLLAEKVEGLSGPDREVDAEIAASLRVGTEHEWALKYPAWIAAKDGRVHLEKNGPSFAAPAFTASLDAALSLVPADHTIQLSDWDHEALRAKGPWQAIVLPLGARGAMKQFTFSNRCDHAATPALALVAASLRARAAMEAGE